MGAVLHQYVWGCSSQQSIVGKQIIVNFVIDSSLSLDDGGWVDVDGWMSEWMDGWMNE